MTIADKARNAAINFECKKVAYRQSKDGIVVSFVLHPQEVPTALSTSHIGARYIAALVEIGDDEQPITQAEKENDRTPVRTAAQPQPAPKSAGATRNWRDIRPAQQAGIRCDDPIFAAFLREQHPDDWHESGNDAAECVRMICGVQSRSEFNASHAKHLMWHQLDRQFQAWEAKERVGA